MQSNNFSKAFFCAIVFSLLFLFSFEFYWRMRGFVPSYNDDKILWAATRRNIYLPKNQSTIFIGSSRIKFDLDISTWEVLANEEAIQLAMVGTSPRPVLHDLAMDKNFKGKLIIDVVEPLFFSPKTFITEKSAKESIAYFHKESPAQKASAYINHQLESKLVFLEEGKFGLNSLLRDLPVPARAGVFSFPVFPKEFNINSNDRQSFVTPLFLKDSSLVNLQIQNWIKLGALDTTAALKGKPLTDLFESVKADVDKIRSRGGEVVFVRPPSSGGFWETERKIYPRKKYYDALLSYVKAPGIHFLDDPKTANMICPEWSHLSVPDAQIYTRQLLLTLEEKHDWNFPRKKYF